MPSLAGYGDVCSVDSQVACLDECEVRIADVDTVCASCLLENTCFAPDGSCVGNEDVFCGGNGQCTATGWNGSCTYTMGDDAARDACLIQVSPRREVACETQFRPVSECQASCS